MDGKIKSRLRFLLMESYALLTFFITAAILVGGAIAFAYYAAPSSPGIVKSEPYECGIPTEGPTWIQFHVGYYLYAIIYLIFDVETVFIYPWAVVMREMGLTAFIEIVIFFTILGLGLLYAWKKKALIWE
jgi:NADH:ubiquinone oxidoreductase subunit 3 (subunit A)